MKIIVGAGEKKQSGWVSTEYGELNVLVRDDFIKVLNGSKLEAILSEHVFEHLTAFELKIALKNCFEFLEFGGRLRIAVPDGYHPDQSYIDYVRPNGNGAGADSHKQLLNYYSLTNILEDEGFCVELLEWWDCHGNLHCKPWNEIDGSIERCLANDPRNFDGKPHYTSLIVDAFKGVRHMKEGLEKAFAFVEKNDIYKLSPFNIKKTTSFYEVARLAPSGGVIIEVGSYLGMGTAALWYGSEDGNKNRVIAIDPYEENFGWVGERYGPEDLLIWESNMKDADIHPELVKGYSHEVSLNWNLPVSLAMFDIPLRGSLPAAVMDWERHIIPHGFIALRDIDDFSMGTEKAISLLLQTGRWCNRRNWDAFITSIEKA